MLLIISITVCAAWRPDFIRLGTLSCSRVKVLSVPERRGADKLFHSVHVHFIDVGNEREVKSYQLLVLPQQFHSLPGQAIEIVVCNVKPADGETEWHPKVSQPSPEAPPTSITPNKWNQGRDQTLKHQSISVFTLQFFQNKSNDVLFQVKMSLGLQESLLLFI